jgi:hypothetical protein
MRSLCVIISHCDCPTHKSVGTIWDHVTNLRPKPHVVPMTQVFVDVTGTLVVTSFLTLSLVH